MEGVFARGNVCAALPTIKLAGAGGSEAAAGAVGAGAEEVKIELCGTGNAAWDIDVPSIDRNSDSAICSGGAAKPLASVALKVVLPDEAAS